MIALDTSSLIAYFSSEKGKDVEAVELAFEQRQVVLPPIVLSELLSDPKVSDKVKEIFMEIPLLEISEGYWGRVGLSRSKVLAKGIKAKLADTLIAQSCIDHEVPLITRDSDFRYFVKLGLELVVF